MKGKIFILLFISIMLISIKNVKAEEYTGEYSIEYLLRNYNVITLGQNNNSFFTNFKNYYGNISLEPGSVNNINNAEGAILVNSSYYTIQPATFGSQAGTVKSFIKGTKSDYVSTTSELVTDPNYIDFNKMYTQIETQSQQIADNTQYHINNAKIEISKPGIYTIDNAAPFWNQNNNNIYLGSSYYNSLLIKNYDEDSLYIFNYYNDMVEYLPNIEIIEKNSSSVKSLKEYVETGNYKGNIIFNFPNARYLILGFQYSYFGLQFYDYQTNGIIGNIIAPNADVFLGSSYSSYNPETSVYNNTHYGSIIANSVGTMTEYYNIEVKKNNYAIDEKIIKNEKNSYLEKVNDYQDDYYNRDYSIKDLLQNYNLITLGHKAIDSKSKLLEYGNIPGSVKMFHITGQALINGDVYGKIYENESDSYYNNYPRYDRTAFDLISNKVTESYIKGNASHAVIQPWDNMTNDNKNYVYQKNSLYISQNSYAGLGPGLNSGVIDNYINFDRLYNNIVAEQSGIEEGKKAKIGEDGVIHLKTGCNYTIDDISNAKEIVFDDFENNKDNITVITIKNSGDINFPLISRNSNGYKGIVTNDYYGKEHATHFYEQNTFVQDSYYGNIIWNVPNATYIKLHKLYE